jgi:hypothetical protein
MNTRNLALLLLSAASLAFQVSLTRFFALAQGSHLAFMAISLALLGLGASGTFLTIRPPTPERLPRLLGGGAFLFTLSLPAAYLAINYLPFDAYRLAWEPLQLLWLTLYYLALAVPFFFNGLVIGAALVAQPEQAGLTYAANLLGSGLGPPLALLALTTFGGPGAIFFCALLGWLAACIIRVKEQGSSVKCQVSSAKSQVSSVKCQVSCITFYALLPLLLYCLFSPPALFEVRLIPYKTLSQALLYPDSEVLFSQWNAFSRVDVIQSQSIHSAPGLSFTYTGELPSQLGLTVDGDNLVPLSAPDQPAFTHYLPLALSFKLRPAAEVLVLEPGGGLAVLAALENGAGAVTVVHSNPTVAAAVGRRFADFNGHLYADPRLTLINDEPRSFLRRTDQQFDLIILPLTDSFRPITAGAYSLNEDYRYTVEALADALEHLSPEGLLVVERWLQLPPSESLRLWATAIEALRTQTTQASPTRPDQAETAALAAPATHLFALRSLQTSLIGVARSPLSPQDIATIRTFAGEKQFDLIWLPDVRPAETNQYSILAEPVYYQTFADLLAAPDPESFYRAYSYAIAPPTDDYPFFFHFFKWSQTPQIIQTLGKTWQPFGGSGYLVLVVLLALAILLSISLILLPLLWLKSAAGRQHHNESQDLPLFSPPHSPFPRLLYFGLLGCGFLFVEIPLLQRFILYLGQPAYAFAVVVSALLVASGLGSAYLAGRWSLRLVLPCISGLTLLYPLFLPYLFGFTLSLPFAGRVGVTLVALLPLGLLLGIPFPRGLSLVGSQLAPWAWAVNGCISVVSAVLAAMIALTWGFSAVLWSAALAYGVAWLVVWGVEGREGFLTGEVEGQVRKT